jgi:N-acetylmuramoyl-L-alanine amidase
MKFLFFIMFSLMGLSASAAVVLIDPGHGGEESGAVGALDHRQGKKVYEKDLSLRLARKIKEELRKKNTTAYLTRSLDRSVTLQERADLADLVKADLFISIHFNSSPDSKIKGFELYYLDNSSNVATAKVEKAENLNLKGEELIVNQILVDLVVQQTVSHSRRLAKEVHEKVRPVVLRNKMVDRGIKPGLFYVLALSKRPGLLIEVGFMSNQDELKMVSGDRFLTDMARGISEGVWAYIHEKK